MKIVSLNIENYRAIDELRIPFVDALGKPRRITVLAGPNGCGKTSTLHAILHALGGVTGYRTADVPDPTRDDIRAPSAASGWSDNRPEIHVDVEIQFDDQEQRAIPELNQILGLKPPPTLPNGCVTVHWTFPPGFKDGMRLNWWNASVEPAVPNIRSWLGARRAAIRAWKGRQPGMRYDLLLKIGGPLFFPQDRNLRERVIGDEPPTQSRPSDADEVRENETESQFDRPSRRERPISEILYYFSTFAKNREQPVPDDQNWQKRVQDTFHRICSPKQYRGYLYRGDDPLGAPILQDDGREYPLSKAASGEQVILEYITRLTHPSPAERNIVLVDEPEIHLHPAWIRHLYLALPKIGADNQYILTTHSEELRERAAADNALIDLGRLGEKK